MLEYRTLKHNIYHVILRTIIAENGYQPIAAFSRVVFKIVGIRDAAIKVTWMYSRYNLESHTDTTCGKFIVIYINLFPTGNHSECRFQKEISFAFLWMLNNWLMSHNPVHTRFVY